MPDPKTYTISLKAGGPDPDNLKVNKRDKIIFHNAMSEDTTISFSRPCPFSPVPHPLQIAAGNDAPSKNVNGSTGTYEYKTPEAELGTRSGTIKV